MKRGLSTKRLALLLPALVVLSALAILVYISNKEAWPVFKDPEEKIQFLAPSNPEKSQSQSEKTTTITWSFGPLADGTNGYLDATRLKQGSFAGLDVILQADSLRSGVEAGGKTRVTDQHPITVSGHPAIEFVTQTVTSKGSTWYGMVRMFVLADTLYTIGLSAPDLSILEGRQAQAFLSSFKKTE